MKSASLKSLLFVLICCGVASVALAAVPSSNEEWKAFMAKPGFLLIVMYLGALASALKTVKTAQRDGSDVTLAGYFTSWETIVAAIIAVPIAWAGLLYGDQLNFAAAAAYGAVANTSLDVLKSGGRSSSLQTTTEDKP